jgi:hypothetical protein
VRRAAIAIAQIDDECVRRLQEPHRRGNRVARDVRLVKLGPREQTDVAAQPLHAVNAEAVLLRVANAIGALLRRLGHITRVGLRFVLVAKAQMAIASVFLQQPIDHRHELECARGVNHRLAVDGRPECGSDLLPHCGIEVIALDTIGGRLNDLRAFRRSNGKVGGALRQRGRGEEHDQDEAFHDANLAPRAWPRLGVGLRRRRQVAA